MANSLSERIAARAAKQNPSRSAQNRATFLALRADIKQAMEDGWPVKTVWETLQDEGKVSFSYQAFRGYVNRLILTSPAPQPALAVLPAALELPRAAMPEQQVKAVVVEKKPVTIVKPDSSPGFKFNPVADKKELL